MQPIRWLFALSVLSLCARGAGAQARPQGAKGSMRDTLPERVVQRTSDAYIRKDLDATFANFDSVFMHEYLGDPAGAKRVRRDDWLRQLKSDTAAIRRMKTGHGEVVRHDVFGPFVNDVWVFTTADGKKIKHFELLEVRHGKIVREIES